MPPIVLAWLTSVDIICLIFFIGDIGFEGFVTTIAGRGTATFADGVGTAAALNTPRGITVSSLRLIYVTDTANHRVRVISTSGSF